MTVEKMFQTLYATKSVPAQLDLGMQVLLAGHIPNKRWQTCLMKNDDQLCWMAQQADGKFFTINGSSKEVLFVAAYTQDRNYPFPRWYCITTLGDPWVVANKIEVLRDRGFHFKPVHPAEVEKLYGCEGELNTIAESFLERKRNSIPSDLRRLLQGRSLYTELEQSFIISSNECLLCKAADTEYCISTVKVGVVSCVVYNLCQKCFAESTVSNLPLFEYVARKLGSPPIGEFQPCSEEEMIHDVVDLLRQCLDCDEIVYVEERKTITAKRKSGFDLIFRLNGVCDYAYMIMNPKGKQVARFDCADHHQIEGAPHHLHFDTRTKRSNRVISPSYFIGSPLFDLKGFKALLEGKEAEERSSS